MFKFKTEKMNDFLVKVENNSFGKLKSLTAIAKEIHRHRGTVSKILNGNQACSEKIAIMLTNLINVSVDEYFDKT